jgi:hypothetical protein
MRFGRHSHFGYAVGDVAGGWVAVGVHVGDDGQEVLARVKMGEGKFILVATDFRK